MLRCCGEWVGLLPFHPLPRLGSVCNDQVNLTMRSFTEEQRSSSAADVRGGMVQIPAVSVLPRQGGQTKE